MTIRDIASSYRGRGKVPFEARGKSFGEGQQRWFRFNEGKLETMTTTDQVWCSALPFLEWFLSEEGIMFEDFAFAKGSEPEGMAFVNCVTLPAKMIPHDAPAHH